MKIFNASLFKVIITTIIVIFETCISYSQGNIQINIEGLYRTSENVVARTRIGSLTGELAGADIYGQMLVGLSVDSLSPVGLPGSHLVIDGENSGWIILGPDIPIEIAGHKFYGQLAVWDSSLWGKELQNVPTSQIGYSDIASSPGYNGLGPNPSIVWNESAIVPIIPEVNTIGSFLFGCSLFTIMHLRNRFKSDAHNVNLAHCSKL